MIQLRNHVISRDLFTSKHSVGTKNGDSNMWLYNLAWIFQCTCPNSWIIFTFIRINNAFKINWCKHVSGRYGSFHNVMFFHAYETLIIFFKIHFWDRLYELFIHITVVFVPSLGHRESFSMFSFPMMCRELKSVMGLMETIANLVRNDAWHCMNFAKQYWHDSN